MRNLVLASVLTLAAACASDRDVVSSVNFVQGTVDPSCAVDAVGTLGGFDLAKRRDGSRRTRAVFEVADREELLLNVRTPKNQGHEVYVSMRPSEPENPLNFRASRIAVQQADEAIYLNCTEDGRTFFGSSVLVQGQKE